jgi:signal transduction histidine kinase
MACSVTGQGDTDPMAMNRAFWLMRFAAYAVIGLLALVNPPHSHPQRAVQILCFSAVGVALLVCVALDLTPRYAARGMPIALCVMAIFGGLAAVTTGGGQTLIVFAAIAAMAAGTDIAMPVPIVVALAGIIPIWIAGPFAHSTLGTLGGYPVLIMACVLWGRNRRSYRVQAEQAAALLEQSKLTQAEQRRADVLDERARIAREIHDVLAHSLGALGIQIQSAKAMLTDRGDIEHAVEALSTAQRIAADGLTETRRAVHALRVDSLPLNEELAGVVETHRQRYRVPVVFETSGEVRPLPPDASLAMLRAGQEALVNAAKHAPGQPIAMKLDYTDADVRLSVVNHTNGTVVTDKKPGLTGGYGLTGMGERLRLLNGTLQAGPRDNEWAVTAELPLTAEDVTAR